MPDNVDDIDSLQPQKLVQEFSKSPIVKWLCIAIALHVVIIGGSSLTYIYYGFVNPKAGEEREARIREERRAANEAMKPPPPPPATNTTAAASTNDPGSTNWTETPQGRRITDAASPDEIPDEPDDLDLSIEETNPF